MGEDYKGKRQQAMTEGFRRAYGGPSMGAKVEAPVCSICGSSNPDHGHLADTSPGGITFFMVSMVPAPKCETCGESMTYLKRGTDWTCTNESCSQHGISVTTGIGGVVGSVE